MIKKKKVHFLLITLVVSALSLITMAGLAKANELTADRAVIVDCLLPGQVRKLGINRTYISRKQPIKASGNECEIRGGDYVQFDRANLASSLNVWQESASQGDAKAQYFVGEIYEKGLGTKPDYPLAVTWYQRAAKQKYKPAMMSLGRLHELGLGVPKDLVKAMNLYRHASGLTDDDIAYASVFEKIQQDDEQRIAQLEKQLAQEKNNAKRFNSKVTSLQGSLKLSREKLKNLKQEIDALKRELSTASAQNKARLQAMLTEKQTTLKTEATNNNELVTQLNQTRQQLFSAKKKLNKLVPNGQPVIALKWPQFERVDGVDVSVVAAGSVVNVVGAVRAIEEITSFTINGDSYQLDANNLFLKSVEVGSDPIDISVNLTDKAGNQVASKLLIKPSTDVDVVLRGVGSLTAPKLKFGKYHALVIGNNDYDFDKGWDPLDTAVSDAQEISKLLKEQYGFKVRLELNANRDTILIALEEMRKTLTDKDNLLVYYAGHGLLDPENNQGYWVPIDGSIDSSARWVSNASITDQIRAMSARNVMVIADSCYSASLMRSGIVSLRSGLTPEKKIQRLGEDVQQLTRVAFSSGGLQPVADSINGGKNSVFASALLNVLKSNDKLLDADSLATQVAHAVAVATKDSVKQVPRFAPLAGGGHQGGEFYFAPKKLNSL